MKPPEGISCRDLPKKTTIQKRISHQVYKWLCEPFLLFLSNPRTGIKRAKMVRKKWQYHGTREIEGGGQFSLSLSFLLFPSSPDILKGAIWIHLEQREIQNGLLFFGRVPQFRSHFLGSKDGGRRKEGVNPKPETQFSSASCMFSPPITFHKK